MSKQSFGSFLVSKAVEEDWDKAQGLALAIEKKGDSAKHRISAAHRSNVEAFYYDAKNFVNSNRFLRFVAMVDDGLKQMLKDMGMYQTYRDSAETPTFMQIVEDAIRTQSFDRYYEENRDNADEFSDEMKEIAKVADRYDRTGTSIELVGAFLDRGQSMLWLMEVLSDEETDWNEDDEDTYPRVLKNIARVVCSDVFELLYRDALVRACYDYIHFHAVDKGLNETTWMATLKKLSYSQLLLIGTKAFEYTLYNVEDRAAYSMMCIDAKESLPDALRKLKRDEALVETLQRLRENDLSDFTDNLLAKSNEIEELKRENAHLKSELENKDSSGKEVVKLQRELAKLRKQKDELQGKYDSAVKYADMLVDAADESLKVQEPAQVNSEDAIDTGQLAASLSDKRIVFVRDKRQQDYVLMNKLAELFPNARFTNCIASDINAKATDLIVCLTLYVHHSTYYKADSIARQKNIPMLNTKNANVGIITKQIWEEFNSLRSNS